MSAERKDDGSRFSLAVNDGNLLYPSGAINRNGQGVVVIGVAGPTGFPSVGYAQISNAQVANSSR
jgi:hypothetical protein